MKNLCIIIALAMFCNSVYAKEKFKIECNTLMWSNVDLVAADSQRILNSLISKTKKVISVSAPVVAPLTQGNYIKVVVCVTIKYDD